MSEKRNNLLSLNLAPKLTLAAIVATGMAASPVALSGASLLTPNSVAAQNATPGASTGGEGAAEEFVDGGAGATTDVHENVYLILGTTAEEVRSEVDQVSANADAGPLAEYESAMRDGNLDAAARVLASASNRLITEKLVLDLNNSLGVESRLTAKQVADAGLERQDPDLIVMIPYIGDGSDSMQPLNTNTRAFNEYEEEATQGNLDAAAEALAEATEHPITEGFVLFVNRDLGVETTLTARQVAEVASQKQDETY
ncbi:hypothetical protein [Pelagibius sp. 7325]|uniref:hypothetical protein n=1 Tax=Pelagibius sp. 7325 TaxID=3131994 RepID=UPI0030EF907B